MNKILASLLFLFGPAFVYAQDTRSEFFYQAGADEAFIQGNLEYLYHKTQTNGPSFNIKDTGINLAFEQGLNSLFSIYGNMGFGVGKLSGITEADFTGIDPINLGAKARMIIGPGEFYGKANLGFGALSDLDCDSSGDCNRTDGSIDLALRLGYLLSQDTFSFGFAIDIGLFATDGRNKLLDVDIEKEGGVALTAFYERLITDKILGAALSYTMSGMSGSAKFDPFIWGLFNADGSGDDANFLGLKLYTRAPLNEGLAILGSINYDFALSHNDNGVDSGHNFGVNVGARLML